MPTEPITDEERRQEAEVEALVRQITAEDPDYWDRLVERVSAEVKAEGQATPLKSARPWKCRRIYFRYFSAIEPFKTGMKTLLLAVAFGLQWVLFRFKRNSP